MRLVYKTRVVRLGNLAADFFREGMMVLFQEGAPRELEEISVIHRPEVLWDQVRPGDTLRIGSTCVKVTAVGEVANRNLANLGHAVIKFNGLIDPELPGDLCAERGDIPSVEPGTGIEIIRHEAIR